MFIAFISRNNLLERLDPAKEPFNSPSFFIQYRIEPPWPSPLRVYPGSPVDRDIALDPSFPVVLANFPGIVGGICGDDRRTNLHFGNLKCFEFWFIEPGNMDICR